MLGVTADSANRSFSDIMGMLTPIDSALHTNYHSVWEKARIKETNATKADERRPSPISGSPTRSSHQARLTMG
ncbi:hypothetical protein [Sinorhizobium meliloti]|nr:hypothetical protein U8C39_36355 [Sinorhizobium meliloti]WQP20184.1 hypothetical protein U8C33_35200 [Sinorhizobium meliloti]WQP36146.1 hypothetical protein U8C45_37245 [Sinorhizobium meliloti]